MCWVGGEGEGAPALPHCGLSSFSEVARHLAPRVRHSCVEVGGWQGPVGTRGGAGGTCAAATRACPACQRSRAAASARHRRPGPPLIPACPAARARRAPKKGGAHCAVGHQREPRGAAVLQGTPVQGRQVTRLPGSRGFQPGGAQWGVTRVTPRPARRAGRGPLLVTRTMASEEPYNCARTACGGRAAVERRAAPAGWRRPCFECLICAPIPSRERAPLICTLARCVPARSPAAAAGRAPLPVAAGSKRACVAGPRRCPRRSVTSGRVLQARAAGMMGCWSVFRAALLIWRGDAPRASWAQVGQSGRGRCLAPGRQAREAARGVLSPCRRGEGRAGAGESPGCAGSRRARWRARSSRGASRGQSCRTWARPRRGEPCNPAARGAGQTRFGDGGGQKCVQEESAGERLSRGGRQAC